MKSPFSLPVYLQTCQHTYLYTKYTNTHLTSVPPPQIIYHSVCLHFRRRFPNIYLCLFFFFFLFSFPGLNLTVGHMRQPLLSPSLRLFLSPKSSVSMKRPEDAISSSLSRCQAAILRGPSLLNSTYRPSLVPDIPDRLIFLGMPLRAEVIISRIIITDRLVCLAGRCIALFSCLTYICL